MKIQLIRNPGVYGLSLADYHGQPCDGPSISSSGLRRIIKESPAHYWAHSSLNPDRVEDDETQALLLGRAAHHLLLGEDDFSTLFIARPDRFDSWRTKEAKAWKEGQEADGRTVLLSGQLEQIRGMARSLAKHPLIQAGILNGEIEQSLIWKDKDTDIWCKARPDAVPNDSGDFADLKTTPSVRDEALQRTIAEFAYQQQGALICDGYTAITGNKATSFSLVFVEKEPPHCVRVVTLKDDDLARGERQNNAALKIVKRCLESGEWPGPGRADAEFISLPPWEQSRIDYELEQLEAA